MEASWLLSPHFFEEYEPGLAAAAPEEAKVNGPYEISDRSPSSLKVVHAPIAAFVRDTVDDGNIPVSVAGDCGASIPVMAGLQAAGLNPQLIWLDAHADFNTPETSPSQFLGGMPLAMIVGRGPQDIGRNVALNPISEQDVWLVGARDIDPLEEVALESSAVNRIALDELAALSVDRPVHLHLDNDVLDATEVPANNYPAPNGPSSSELIAACTKFISANNVAAISFSGWNSQLDGADATGKVCEKVLSAFAAAATKIR
jgi:arginase